MIILPLKFNFTEVCPVAKLGERCVSHVFTLPDTEEATILLICVQLHPIVSLIPRHAHLLEIVQEIYRCVGMLA